MERPRKRKKVRAVRPSDDKGSEWEWPCIPPPLCIPGEPCKVFFFISCSFLHSSYRSEDNVLFVVIVQQRSVDERQPILVSACHIIAPLQQIPQCGESFGRVVAICIATCGKSRMRVMAAVLRRVGRGTQTAHCHCLQCVHSFFSFTSIVLFRRKFYVYFTLRYVYANITRQKRASTYRYLQVCVRKRLACFTLTRT